VAHESGMPDLVTAMRWSYDNFYVKGHNNRDERETYISCLEDDLPKLFGYMDNLTGLVKQLAHKLGKAAPGNDLSARALDYLRRKGLLGSPLRDAGALATSTPTDSKGSV
jgi:hypothetical protein